MATINTTIMDRNAGTYVAETSNQYPVRMGPIKVPIVVKG